MHRNALQSDCGWLSRSAAPSGLKRLAAALAIAAAGCGGAQAQGAAPTAACIEIVPGQTGVSPTILADKCNGQTWQLVPSAPRSGGYVWRPLNREQWRTAQAVPRVARPRPAAARVAPALNAKCFTFARRTFCE